jgi:cadmium resistance protein CadD (predicted permease)
MIKRLLFIGSFFGTLALMFFKKDLYHLNVMTTDGKTFLVFLMGLLPLWLALWELYQGKMAVRELAWQYSNQALLFSEASRRLEALENEDAKLTIIEELADTSLIEALQWTVHRFHRDHEPPTAG